MEAVVWVLRANGDDREVAAAIGEYPGIAAADDDRLDREAALLLTASISHCCLSGGSVIGFLVPRSWKFVIGDV